MRETCPCWPAATSPPPRCTTTPSSAAWCRRRCALPRGSTQATRALASPAPAVAAVVCQQRPRRVPPSRAAATATARPALAAAAPRPHLQPHPPPSPPRHQPHRALHLPAHPAAALGPVMLLPHRWAPAPTVAAARRDRPRLAPAALRRQQMVVAVRRGVLRLLPGLEGWLHVTGTRSTGWCVEHVGVRLSVTAARLQCVSPSTTCCRITCST